MTETAIEAGRRLYALRRDAWTAVSNDMAFAEMGPVGITVYRRSEGWRVTTEYIGRTIVSGHGSTPERADQMMRENLSGVVSRIRLAVRRGRRR